MNAEDVLGIELEADEEQEPAEFPGADSSPSFEQILDALLVNKDATGQSKRLRDKVALRAWFVYYTDPASDSYLNATRSAAKTWKHLSQPLAAAQGARVIRYFRKALKEWARDFLTPEYLDHRLYHLTNAKTVKFYKVGMGENERVEKHIIDDNAVQLGAIKLGNQILGRLSESRVIKGDPDNPLEVQQGISPELRAKLDEVYSAKNS